MGGRDYGILACSGYEHEEGRAWDWGNNAADPVEAARVQKVLDWMFATDSAGNPHAMARRLGIAYVIWNRQVINMYSSDNLARLHGIQPAYPPRARRIRVGRCP
jgi:hypothetical protein